MMLTRGIAASWIQLRGYLEKHIEGLFKPQSLVNNISPDLPAMLLGHPHKALLMFWKVKVDERAKHFF